MITYRIHNGKVIFCIDGAYWAIPIDKLEEFKQMLSSIEVYVP